MHSRNVRPASNDDYPCLFIGQDRRGRWVVKDRRAMIGGLFTDRTAAIRFAMYECQRRPQSVIMLPDRLELDVMFEDETPGVPVKPLAA